MTKEFEEIKSKFIVDEAEYPEEKITELMEIMLEFLRISKDGQVVIVRSVSTRKILPLILSARFVANKVDKQISDEITKEELLNYSYLQKDIFTARFSELLREGFADASNDKIKARNILLVERFLKHINGEKRSRSENMPKLRVVKGKSSKPKRSQISKTKEEAFDINGNADDIKSLKDYIQEKNPETNKERVVTIANYIVEFLKQEEFSEGQIMYAYTKMGLRKPQAFHQIFLDTKKRQNWISEGSEKLKWNLTIKGEDFVRHDLPRPTKNN